MRQPGQGVSDANWHPGPKVRQVARVHVQWLRGGLVRVVVGTGGEESRQYQIVVAVVGTGGEESRQYQIVMGRASSTADAEPSWSAQGCEAALMPARA